MRTLEELSTFPDLQNSTRNCNINDKFLLANPNQIELSDTDLNFDIEQTNDNMISDIIIAAILLIPVSLLIFLIYLLFLMTIRDKGKFFYESRRLGKRKIVFKQLKIRTLSNNAELSMGKKSCYEGEQKLELWYGMFLRKTRIDELPQIFNILKGDMAFIGPRPLRPILYSEFLFKIKNFDKRFLVRPGLTGYSQFLTPPNTVDKKIRSRIDNMFIDNKPGELRKIVFILWTIYRCTFLIFFETFRIAQDRILMIRNGLPLKNNRTSKREKPKNISSHMIFKKSNKLDFKIVDINSKTMLIESDKKLDILESIELHIAAKIHRRRSRIKRVVCSGFILSERYTRTKNENNLIFRYIVSYNPRSDFHRYIIDKYILKTSVA